MKVVIFQLLIVLFFLKPVSVFGQTTDNAPFIELSPIDFSIERSFTISVTLPNTTTRPSFVFPDLTGLTRRGTTISQTTSEINGKSVVSQVITQDYLAQAAGVFRVAPFAVIINGISVRSPAIILTVRPVAGRPTPPLSNTATLALAEKGGAFLSLTASQTSLYEGQGVMLRLTFYAAENYPYELRFDQVEQQLQTITGQIRPPGAWEENAGINELKPVPIKIKGRAFRQFIIYQTTFFPLRSRPISLPAVTLTMQRVRPPSTPALPVTSPASVTQTERVSFVSQPITIDVKPLPGRVSGKITPVGTFRLVEHLTQPTVSPGQSTQYEFRIEGDGNIATLPPPTVLTGPDLDIFPPEVRQVINRTSNPVNGQKSFRYFIIPRQKGQLSLANTFQWVYFNPQTARYDTLRPQTTLKVGGLATSFDRLAPDSTRADATETAAQNSIYMGIGQLDSHNQPLNFSILVRAVADVLIVVMLLGMIYIFFRK